MKLYRNPKLLIVSLHIAGGCQYYSNRLIEQMGDNYIVVSKKVVDNDNIAASLYVRYAGYSRLSRYISLFLLLARIIVLGRLGYFNGMLLCGYTSWDYYIMKAWKLTGKKSFFIVHDGKMHPGEDSADLQKKLVKIMQWSDSLIFLSEHVRQEVEKNFGIDKPFHIAPHGLIDYGGEAKKTITSPPTLLFLGRVNYYKGVDVLLKAIENVPNDEYAKLVIAGKWSCQRKYRQNDKVIFWDKWLTEDEMKELLVKADIMVFPYREASQSGVLTLAINYGIPYIISNAGALPYQAPDGGGMILQDLNPDNLTAAIVEMCNNHELLQKMKNVMLAEKSLYSWNIIGLNLRNYINESVMMKSA